MSESDGPDRGFRDARPTAGETGETVAVVVVTYNRADLLRHLLAGLGQLDPPADAVIVVDNASTDHTAAVLAESTLPGLRVIANPENTGGAGGFHTGVKAA